MKHKSAICTCIKDEQDYLKEWIEYHLRIGFNHIYLYEDNGSKPHKEIVDLFPDSVTLFSIDVVKNEPVTTKQRQMQMYVYSMKTIGDMYDWLAFIDADEFIDFEEGWNLERLLSEYDSFPAIMLSWMLYAANGRIEKPSGNVIDSYPNPNIEVDYIKIWGDTRWTFKSIVNTRKYQGFKNNHWAHGAVNMNDSVNIELKVFKKAWIRHYYTKSWEEWVYCIIKRGDLCNGNRKLVQFFHANPDMIHMKKELMVPVANQIPHGNKNYWLNTDWYNNWRKCKKDTKFKE